jgi:hypothetical protein
MAEDSPPEIVRPLHDVWLRPRRVARQLASVPIGRADYVLGAAQGVLNWLVLSRVQSVGAHTGVATILERALVIGPVAGLLGMYLRAAVYLRLGRRAQGVASRAQLVHVLAYSGVPMLASLLLWLLTAALAGRALFLANAPAHLAPFVLLVLRLQIVAHAMLVGWSLLLQVMGLSEAEGLPIGRAFGVWVLGQVLVLLALLLLRMILVSVVALPLHP